MTEYNRFHTDFNALRLHAQVLYWMKNFDRSIKVYDQTISLFPNVSAVKLDYGRVMFEMGKHTKAQDLLTDHLIDDSLNIEANTMMAYLNMWSGHQKKAIKRANMVLKQFPDNKEALDILNEINIITAPYVSAGTNFQSDYQPNKANSTVVETGMYRS